MMKLLIALAVLPDSADTLIHNDSPNVEIESPAKHTTWVIPPTRYETEIPDHEITSAVRLITEIRDWIEKRVGKTVPWQDYRKKGK